MLKWGRLEENGIPCAASSNAKQQELIRGEANSKKMSFVVVSASVLYRGALCRCDTQQEFISNQNISLWTSMSV